MSTPSLPKELAQQAIAALKEYNGNKSAAARALNLKRSAFVGRLQAAAIYGYVADVPAPPVAAPPVSVDMHTAELKAREVRKNEGVLLKALGTKVTDLESQLEALLAIKKSAFTYRVQPTAPDKSEAAAIWLASDWHVGERVTLDQTNGLNEYNPDIAKARGDNFFVNALRLTEMTGKDVGVGTVVLGLLGDFITGHLHSQAVETNYFAPVEETIFAQSIIASGIRFVLQNSPYKLVIVCKSGNHGRTTKFSEFGSENGHSHEYFMFCSLREMFKDEPRAEFIITEGAHTYIDVFSKRVRFLHGHDIKYGGGVGGITIPVNKALAQWDKVKRADLTCFGHFHQRIDGGNFLCNGSLIGYNAFALSIKASAEPPAQQFALLDKERGKTIVAPILLD